MKQHQKRMLEGSHRDSPDDDAENKEQDVAVSTMSDVEAQSGRARTSASRRRQTEESDGDDKLGEQEEEEGFLSGASFWILITLLLAAIITVAVVLYFYCCGATEITLRFTLEKDGCKGSTANGELAPVTDPEIVKKFSQYQWIQKKGEDGCFQYYHLNTGTKAHGVLLAGSGALQSSDLIATTGVLREPTKDERYKERPAFNKESDGQVTVDDIPGVEKGTPMWYVPGLGSNNIGGWYYYVGDENGAHRVLEITSIQAGDAAKDLNTKTVYPYCTALVFDIAKEAELKCGEAPANGDLADVTVEELLNEGLKKYQWMQASPNTNDIASSGCFQYHKENGDLVSSLLLSDSAKRAAGQTAFHGVVREPTQKERKDTVPPDSKAQVTVDIIEAAPHGTPMWYEPGIGNFGAWYYYTGGKAGAHRVLEILWIEDDNTGDKEKQPKCHEFRFDKKDSCPELPPNGNRSPVTDPELLKTVNEYEWLKSNGKGCFQYYADQKRMYGMEVAASDSKASGMKTYGVVRAATDKEQQKAESEQPDPNKGIVKVAGIPGVALETPMWYVPTLGQLGTWYYATDSPRVFEVLSIETIKAAP